MTTRDDVTEFEVALDNYKKQHGRMFPTCSEILEVAQAIGYRKCDAGECEPLLESWESEQDDSDSDSDFDEEWN